MSPPVQAAMNSMYYAIVYPAAIQPNPDSIKGRGKIPMSRNRFLSITKVILTTYPLDLHHGSLSLLGDYFYQRIHLPESLLSVFWQKQTLALNQENRLANALVSYTEYNSLTDLLQYLHLSSFRPKSSEVIQHQNKERLMFYYMCTKENYLKFNRLENVVFLGAWLDHRWLCVLGTELSATGAEEEAWASNLLLLCWLHWCLPQV
ncbi:unnamed protein product [Caretta caretta]